MPKLGIRKIAAFMLAAAFLLPMLLTSNAVQGKEERFDIVKEGNSVLMRDDFSRDPIINWTFLNAARWDAGAQQIVLTEPGSERVGVIWLKRNVTSPFIAEFRYRVGGGTGADGFVFMFYKDSNYEPGIGGYLGFLCRPVEKPCPRNVAPGYGLEFDNYLNSKEAYGMGDPSPNHIAFLKDDINNHLVYVNDSRTEDDKWHQVKLMVQENEIVAYVDEDETLRWSGPVNRSFGGVGFGSGIWGLNHKHIIDDFRIYGNTITIQGLQQGWTAELMYGNKTLAKGVASRNGTEAVMEVSSLPMPLEGHFRIYDENKAVYDSLVLRDIWGGDVWLLRTLSAPSAEARASETGWDPQVVLAVAGVSTVAVLLGLLILRRKNTP
ncbi:MAG: hypothetical protein M1503_01005 [Thaumarchaeota archaeon]|nr:hypothetical protein [Nitrososphaerota archaeon]MCL5316833.1 hypothetical protein [Nitrososphaerota archaeon]